MDKKMQLVLVICIAVILLGVNLYSSSAQPEPIYIPKEQIATPARESNSAHASDKITIQISGAVYNPGVYKIAKGSRVQEALSLVGGVTAKADTAKLNLAKVCRDGQLINVPYKKAAKVNNKATKIPTTTANAAGEIININIADKTQLCTLPGVGAVTAERIIAYREQNGAFSNVEQLLNIKGISQAKLAKIKPLVKL